MKPRFLHFSYLFSLSSVKSETSQISHVQNRNPDHLAKPPPTVYFVSVNGMMSFHLLQTETLDLFLTPRLIY